MHSYKIKIYKDGKMITYFNFLENNREEAKKKVSSFFNDLSVEINVY